MRMKRYLALVLVLVLAMSMVGCKKPEEGSSKDVQTSQNQDTSDSTDAAGDIEYVDIEVWSENIGLAEVPIGGYRYNQWKEFCGVGIYQPYVEWNGGTTYQQQLNLRIAGGDIPDLFQPVNGMEVELAENGALLDLTDLLPEMAPNLWNLVPENVWDVIKSYDPTGEGRIWFIPSVVAMTRMGAMIRQDWLDTLGLDMPTTQDEFVDTLRAFKTQDPNGNGIQDEIPTGGRAEARWMDYLFSMYGIAMWEGYPQWDIYEGELTYSAVTQNMKDALAFLNELYEEGLIDPETLLNDKAAWEGKVNSDQVGVFYHWLQSGWLYTGKMYDATGVAGDWRLMPCISAPGYEGYYTEMNLSAIKWCVANTDDEATIASVMKALDTYADQSLWESLYLGIEGYDYEYNEEGKAVKLQSVDGETKENTVFTPYNEICNEDSVCTILRIGQAAQTEDYMVNAYEDNIEDVMELQKYGKVIAGDGLPSYVYKDYADIQNRKLYVEYASKIIVGEYDIDMFDEFVEKWYAQGGDVVTERARAWYATTQQ